MSGSAGAPWTAGTTGAPWTAATTGALWLGTGLWLRRGAGRTSRTDACLAVVFGTAALRATIGIDEVTVALGSAAPIVDRAALVGGALAAGLLPARLTPDRARARRIRAAVVAGATVAGATVAVAALHTATAPAIPEIVVAGYAATVAAGIALHSARLADRHSGAGRGLAVVALGCSTAVGSLVTRAIVAPAGALTAEPPRHAVAAVVSSWDAAAVLVVLVGLVAPSLGAHAAAARAFRDFRDLRRDVIARWPHVRRPSRSASGPRERVGDRAAETLDALALEAARAGLGPVLGLHGSAIRARTHGDPRVRADAVARWLTSGGGAVSGAEARATPSPAPPSGTTELDWVRLLGRAYRRAHASRPGERISAERAHRSGHGRSRSRPAWGAWLPLG